jgi:hypothetical protein
LENHYFSGLVIILSVKRRDWTKAGHGDAHLKSLGRLRQEDP